jgi:hypothetical protein
MSLSRTRWLAAGPPPVFTSFGGMPVREPEKVVGAPAEASRLTDAVRIIEKIAG